MPSTQACAPALVRRRGALASGIADHVPGSPAAMANELGLRNVSFEVGDLQAAVDAVAADGYGLEPPLPVDAHAMKVIVLIDLAA